MIRLVGVLTGAALAVGLLLLVLGVPELAGPSDIDSRNSTVAAASVAPAEAPPESEAPPEPQPNPAPALVPESDSEPVAESDPEPLAEPEPEAVAEAAPAPEPAALADPRLVPDAITPNTVAEEAAVTQNWYAFWSPFKSKIAAEGFVSELSRTTGLDYRVVKLKPGVYEVAVSYTDDTDIEDKLMRISTATGLDMSGG